MGLFEHWPYTNFHDLNLDWIISRFKNVETAEANAQEYAANAATSAENASASAESAAASETSAGESAEAVSGVADELTRMVQETSARLDTLIISGTPTEGNAELIDIRTGVYGKSYTTAGNAVRGQIKENIENSSYDVLNNGLKQNKTSHGVTFTWLPDNSIDINAPESVSSTTNLDLYSSVNTIPEWITKGKTYKVKYDNLNGISSFRMYGYVNEELQPYFLSTKTDTDVTIPEDITGLIIRITIPSRNAPMHEIVKPMLLTAESNEALDKKTAELTSTISEIYSAVNMIGKEGTVTMNILDPSTITEGYLLVTDVPTENTDFFYSDYIKTGETEFYYSQGGQISNLCSCYNSSHEFLGSISYSTNVDYIELYNNDKEASLRYAKITPLPGTVYVRMNGRLANGKNVTPFLYPGSNEQLPYLEKIKINDIKIAMFGDSITYGTNGDNGTRVDKTIPDYVHEITGFSVDNFGVGSMGWCSTQYLDRIAYDEITAHDLSGYDVVTLCYGVNDSAATLGDWNDSHEDTIMGQVNKCISYLGTTYPGLKVIVLAPFNGRSYGSFPDWRYSVRTSGGFTRYELSDAEQQACSYYWIDFISQKDSPLAGYGMNAYIGTDNVHPNPAGHKALGRWFAAKILTCIK